MSRLELWLVGAGERWAARLTDWLRVKFHIQRREPSMRDRYRAGEDPPERKGEP